MDIALIFVRQYFKYFTCINLFNPQNNSMRQVLLSSSFYWWQSHSQRSNLPMVIQLRSDRTSMAPISSVILKNVLSTTMPCCFPVRMIVILAWCLWGCFFTCSFLLLALSKICTGTQILDPFIVLFQDHGNVEGIEVAGQACHFRYTDFSPFVLPQKLVQKKQQLILWLLTLVR